MFRDFVERGLAVPISEFFHALLQFWGIQLHHLTPQSILHLSIFTYFCEAFLSILPHFHLSQHFFILVPIPNASKPAVVGGCELVLHPENRDEYLSYQPIGKGVEWKSFWFHVGNFESPLPERVAGAPQVQANWSSAGPGGKQVECILRPIATFKNKGFTRDHVLFSFVSRRIQPLQRRKHLAFRNEGTKDPTRLSLEAMAHSKAVKRCCNVLDNFDKNLKLPALFSAVNPPERTWISIEKHCQVLVNKHFLIF